MPKKEKEPIQRQKKLDVADFVHPVCSRSPSFFRMAFSLRLAHFEFEQVFLRYIDAGYGPLPVNALSVRIFGFDEDR
jgi:hypothetical protein